MEKRNFIQLEMKNKSGTVILIPNQIEFKTEAIIRDIKGSS